LGRFIGTISFEQGTARSRRAVRFRGKTEPPVKAEKRGQEEQDGTMVAEDSAAEG
jgi:hypothetical protein